MASLNVVCVTGAAVDEATGICTKHGQRNCVINIPPALHSVIHIDGRAEGIRLGLKIGLACGLAIGFTAGVFIRWSAP
jgi:hypothetical protein